jgi:hypothetical protein
VHRSRPRRLTLATRRPVAGPDVSPDTFACARRFRGSPS